MNLYNDAVYCMVRLWKHSLYCLRSIWRTTDKS